MKVASEGIPFIVGSALILSASTAISTVRHSWPLTILSVVLLIVTLWVIYFFRDPERTGDRGEKLVISPADGRISHIVEVDEPGYLHGKAIRISVFMNIFNVHVNRYPVSGKVRYLHYNPGKFLNAATEKSSLENEQMSVGIEISDGRRILVRQIAGLVARRIITYSKDGDRAEQGTRFGLIRFGSRVDVFVPLGSKVLVKIGDKPLAGATVLAELT